MLLAWSLFGHRHANPTFLDRILDPLRAVPVPIWVAIIGIVAAALTPLLSHYLTRRRDKATAEREDRLRTEQYERRAARVRADVLVRLRSHCANLQPLVQRGSVDADLWQAAHDALLRRARDAEVIDALGPTYHGFMQAIHNESVAINLQRAKNAEAASRGGGSELHDFSSDNVAGVLAGYATIVRALGDDPTATVLDTSLPRSRSRR